MLEGKVELLNEITNSPTTPYTRDSNGKLRANIGNFHLYGAYGKWDLHRTVNEGGGSRDHFGLCSKRELYDQISAFIKGIEFEKVSLNKG